MRTASPWLLFYKRSVAKLPKHRHTHPPTHRNPSINTTVGQIQETTGVVSTLKPGILTGLLTHHTQQSESADKESHHFQEDAWFYLTYIWNNGILSGGKESAVSRNLQADKYKTSSLWGISATEGPFPSATFILLILLLFL